MNHHRGSTIIYAIFLTVLTSVVAYVLFTKSETLIENLSYQNYDAKLSRNLGAKADAVLKWEQSLNSNGNGFNATRNCPTAVTMSGTVDGGVNETISTIATIENGQIICSGTTISGRNLRLYYSPDYSTFLTGTYLNSININPSGTELTLTGTFSDPEGKYISFALPFGTSNFDGNVNSDDYRVSSIGATDYPDGEYDDDVTARKMVFGYVRQDSGWNSVFWNNAKTNAVVSANANNSDSFNAKISETSTGYLFFDFDRAHAVRIIEFDSGAYLSANELIELSDVESVNPSPAIGWLQNDLSFSWTRTNGDNAKAFDFKNKNYAIFLSYTGTSSTGSTFLKYVITWENQAGSGLYIQPIDDSLSTGQVRYLATDIIINPEGDYLSKSLDFKIPWGSGFVPSGACTWTWWGILNGACFSF